VLRAAWASLPLTVGAAVSDGLHDWSSGARTAASAMVWLGWGLVAVATCLATPAALVGVRVGTAAGLAISAAAASPGVLVALIAGGVAARPEIAEWYVNGPAYPNERRYPLRVPGALLLGPVWVAGAAMVAAPAAAVLLLADGQWAIGIVVSVVAVAAVYVSARALYALTRRWVVFVPAGLVLHDPLALTDPVLFERGVVESLHAAPADTDSLDLTQRALGLALELVLLEKVPMVLARPGGNAESGASARLLFTPTRPGRVLADAAARRVPVG
jgi:hypothetical protein